VTDPSQNPNQEVIQSTANLNGLNGPGRPTKRTAELESQLLGAIEVGATFKLACELVSITEAVFCLWRREDASFALKVDAASAKGDLARLKTINGHGEQDWRAPAWLLERRRPAEYGRQAAHINISANAAAAASAGNGKPPTVFEAMVLADLDFIKLSSHPDYAPKEAVLDGLPRELAPPLHKNGEPGGYVISESLDAADRGVLKAAGRAPGELGNIVRIKVSDEQYAALSKHPAYDFELREHRTDKDALAVPAHLRGRLERRGQNIVLLSASLAAVYDQRLAESRARIDALLKTRQANKDNGQTNTEESPAASEPLLVQIPAARTDNVSASSAPSQKPASWWRQFIFPGALIPKADAVLALKLVLGELRIPVDPRLLDFQTDEIVQSVFCKGLEQFTGSDLGWRQLCQIYERAQARERLWADH
jgi:hypothetical protein